MDLLISGYGEKSNHTIAKYDLDNKGIVNKVWQDMVTSPSFICQGDGYLFTITEADEYAWVYLYKQNAAGFQLVDQKKLIGGSLCHITYSSKNKALFGACYGTGTVFSLSVEKDQFGELLFCEIQHGNTLDTLTRAHCVLLNHQENQLITVNIALDQIIIYDIKEGDLFLNQRIDTPKGVGPRHALFSQEETYLYVITEYSNEILVYRNNEEKSLIQRIVTLSDNFQGTSNCSTLCFSKKGNYLYAANRGADTIAQFEVSQKDGMLHRIGEYNCGGKHPRHMLISKDGSSLIICNQNSHNVVAFCLEDETGVIGAKITEIEFQNPSGILEWGRIPERCHDTVASPHKR